MAGPLRVNATVTIPENELTWRFSRSSGPGGQSVNTTDSRVQVRWDAAASGVLTPEQRERLLGRLSSRLVDGVLQVTSSEQRSQLQNRETAEQRLAQIVAAALAPPARARRATKATRGSQERRIAQKKRRGNVKRLRRDTSD
ncbi:alternative ribosome rescue aminoacyl-tRNA hydrolase ArfB [Kineosporia sp. NBRC 101731]|uniref:alternative ribosome rescue aminoacyl-tRNA hydrolase ArfB n=1 Tax=Kineosporia sp. NBRC 101731 TaxID=3032199 RepID=UPI0024A2D43A|nr:alternative ribosome rescue aminoacyl-tRNA hydrolase ArfB [Kineosporia sp. NBRC 101731]GLY30870.1 aminoacyl-tRNA hydrolase [Kineosporia sp. NBRC 101731]